MAQLLLSVLLIVMFVYVHERVYVKVLQLTIIFLINHLVCTVSQTPNWHFQILWFVQPAVQKPKYIQFTVKEKNNEFPVL